MVKTYRFIALLGDGREHFSDKVLDQEQPTEPVVIDAFGFSDVYRYSGYVFLNETWFTKYSQNWHVNTATIDKLLVNLVKYTLDGAESENLQKIKAYLQSPPDDPKEAAEIWKTFYDPALKRI